MTTPELAPQLPAETPQGRSFTGPVLLISLGIVLLLQTLGFLPWGLWYSVLRLWPLLLVMVGVEILLGRSRIGAGLALVVNLVILALAIWWVSMWFVPVDTMQTTSINQGLNGANRATIQLSMAIGQLDLGAQTTPAGLIDGQATGFSNERLDQSFNLTNGVATYHLRNTDEQDWQLPFTSRDGDQLRWTLRLNPTIPLDVQVQTGAGRNQLDLRQLQLTHVSVNTGVGETNLLLPTQGTFTVDVNGGIGSTTITIPVSLAAQIEARPGLGDVVVDGAFTQHDHTYTTAGYETALSRVYLTVKGGIGQIRLVQVGGR